MMKSSLEIALDGDKSEQLRLRMFKAPNLILYKLNVVSPMGYSTWVSDS